MLKLKSKTKPKARGRVSNPVRPASKPTSVPASATTATSRRPGSVPHELELSSDGNDPSAPRRNSKRPRSPTADVEVEEFASRRNAEHHHQLHKNAYQRTNSSPRSSDDGLQPEEPELPALDEDGEDGEDDSAEPPAFQGLIAALQSGDENRP